MSDWAGFWLGLALVLSVLMVLGFLQENAAYIWPAPAPAPAVVDRCPYVEGC